MCIRDRREGALDIKQAIDASFIDDTYQAEKWGADEEAEERQANAALEMNQAAAFLKFL